MSAPRTPADPPRELQIATFIDTLAAGTRILDVGAGSGTFPYANYPELRVAAVDLLQAPELRGRFARASADHLPFRAGEFDVVIAHWLFEHVDELAGTLDEVRRVLRRGGTLLVAVPNSRSFEDRAYRFVSHVYKYVLLHWNKRIEHVQTITFLGLNQELYRRGFKLVRFREEDAGYCWLDIRQLRPFRAPWIAVLRALRRLGLDLFAGANYRLLYRLETSDGSDSSYLGDDG